MTARPIEGVSATRADIGGHPGPAPGRRISMIAPGVPADLAIRLGGRGPAPRRVTPMTDLPAGAARHISAMRVIGWPAEAAVAAA